jgi:hypothetical protein
MDSTILLIGAGLLFGSLALSLGIERIIRRLGVTPADPSERSGGFRDVVRKLENWRNSRDSTER